MDSLNILAIDQATKSGWCTSSGSGVWDLKIKNGESPGFKWLKFRKHLDDICKKEKINLIVYERIAGMHKASIVHAAKLVAMIEVYCEENQIDHKSYSATEIKKHATKKGNCGKPEMMLAYFNKWGIKPIDDNECDARWLYDLASNTLIN